ncbi:MAG: hypothetical protein ABSH14_06590 [Verrucomicrobiia bacterium]|jgi:general secretion pathway protein D
MNTQILKSKRCLTVMVSLCLCTALEVCAQQRTGGGGGGFGGFGGVGGAAANRNSSSSTSGQQYNPNGAVGNATISVDPDTHNITVIADDETTRYISQVVSNLDRPQPQVLIKVVFVQVTHSDALDFGVEGGWMNGVGGGRTGVFANVFGLSGLASGTGSNAPIANVFGQPIQSFQQIAPFAAGPGAGMYQVLGSDFQATLRAIAQAGKAEVLSRPSILARNDQPAMVQVGQNVPLVTSVSFNTLSGTPINSITYTPVGIILTVTPYITQDGLVQMIVSPQDSSIDPTLTVPISAGVSAPVIDIVAANTVVITPNGQTVVIGGLMQHTKASAETKIPFLGDIPLLGNLFKRKTTTTAKEELLIFLTPYVIEAPSQLIAMSSNERAHSLVPKSYSEQELDRFLDKLPVKSHKNGS